MKTLYVVAVPIGNLKEITLLALEKLQETKVIFCEDTRVTKNLFKKLNITLDKKFLSVNQFNESEKFGEIFEFLSKQDCVLVSDAGYPVISDPGYFLIKKLRIEKANIQVINGPCAFIHALVGSGIDSRKIYWANFLSKKQDKRKNQLKELLTIHKLATIVFYEAKNFLENSLSILMDVFGDIKICVAKELTKIHETFYYDYISNLKNTININGEFVVLIPKEKKNKSNNNLDEILEKIHFLIKKKNLTLASAIKVYKNNEFNSSFLYKEYHEKYKPNI